MKKNNFKYLAIFIFILISGCGMPNENILDTNPDPKGQTVPSMINETQTDDSNHDNPNLTEINDTEEEDNNVENETQADPEDDIPEEEPEEEPEEPEEEPEEEEPSSEPEEPESENTSSCFSYIDCPNQEACNVVSSTCFLCTDNWHCNNQFDLQQVGPSFCCTLEDIENQRCDLVGTCQE